MFSFSPKILYTHKQSVFGCRMKLHIVVMPQRGLFQGFGTHGPDWEEEEEDKKNALLWALGGGSAPGVLGGGRLQHPSAVGKTLGTRSTGAEPPGGQRKAAFGGGEAGRAGGRTEKAA